MLQTAREDREDGLKAAIVLKKAKKEKRLQDQNEKALYGQYLRQTNEVRSEQSWLWLQNGDLKRETESLIVPAKIQSIRTNLVKAQIDKIQKDTLCRLRKKADESIDDFVSGCSKLALKEYKRRHDNLGKIVHWKLARRSNFETGDKWYEYGPESVLENEDYKILRNFSIQTDHVIEVRRLDLAVVDKNSRTCKTIDLEFLEIVGLRKRRKRRSKVSTSKKGFAEDLEFESENCTISCGLFRCYT